MAFIGKVLPGLRTLLVGIVAWAGLAGTAAAEGGAKNWQMGFRPAASPTAEEIHWFNDVILLPIIVAIVVFVMGLLVYVMWRFSEKRNPTPSKTTHNTVIEVLWTAIPVIILVIIAIPSFKLLYFADRTEESDITLKATGHTWYWSYQYPDFDNIEFDAYLVPEEDLKEGQKRLLTTDNVVVLPVETNIRLLITAADVLHSFALPAMGIKLDAVPGRVNETWLRINEEGTYYGQCSELCGTGHSYMPIMVKAVSKAEFERWIVQAKEEFAAEDSAENKVRLAEAAAVDGAAEPNSALAGN
jgi:cytochrome c oxidase subunit 2